MNIVTLTNTYLPHVGGVARSVERFVTEYRAQGHRVIIVAPEFPDLPDDETDVIRVPAVQNFNGSDFSVRLPVPFLLEEALSDCRPDLVHSHHPFLLGDTALRIASEFAVPLVFTHHTRYEDYTHYVPGDSDELKQFVIQLSTNYANLCQRVFAPSESIAELLRSRGVEVPVTVVPTGVLLEDFAGGSRKDVRNEFGIAENDFVVGHVGRLAQEKNLAFLSRAVCKFLSEHSNAHFVLVGGGPFLKSIEDIFQQAGLRERLHIAGVRRGQELKNAYAAMDVFAFASHTETQGMVLTEAMAADVPVVALDAPGAREVVKDCENGRLLPEQHVREFAEALSWVAARDEAAMVELRKNAFHTAEAFSMERCATNALEAYQQTIRTFGSGEQRSSDLTAWEASLKRLELEFELLTAKSEAAKRALRGVFRGRRSWLSWFYWFGRKCRRFFRRGEWAIHLLSLPTWDYTDGEPGLVLIQIDGLSKRQLERAIANRRMPFLRRLQHKHGYTLFDMYSGVPSTTPAVQAELLYGVRGKVPAFQFFDRSRKRLFTMFEPNSAATIETELSDEAAGLLRGGSTLSNIYTGGAAESSFCPAAFGWGKVLSAANPFGLLLLFLAYFGNFVRALFLSLFELVIAVFDSIHGIAEGESLFAELKFVPTRAGICIFMREMITIGAVVDVRRGVPALHLNFLGYDEQAHRRGPQAKFAHWTLKGIDRSIKRIWRSARRSPRREYQVWIFSDHGQEHCVSYMDLYGVPVAKRIREVLGAAVPASDEQQYHLENAELKRGRWLAKNRFSSVVSQTRAERRSPGEYPIVTAMGPLALVYLDKPVLPEDRISLAQKLQEEAQLPIVLFIDQDDRVAAVTAAGSFRLPEDAGMILGEDHPHLSQAAKDLEALCRNPYSGDFVVSGWRPGEQPMTFPQENGSHGGPGFEETSPFALLPEGVMPAVAERNCLRPSDLYVEGMRLLRRKIPPTHQLPGGAPARRSNETIRVMTYNVHGCVGIDGRLSPSRIARVIAAYDPDIIALQELDVGRERSEFRDQAAAIARQLEMNVQFHASFQVRQERYGNAVISRFPIRFVRGASLPKLPEQPTAEPRGVLWAEIDCPAGKLQFLTTHFGLQRKEREAQVAELLGEKWLQSAREWGPVIVCGDFNFGPRSQAYQAVVQEFRDAQVSLEGHRPRNTWLSRLPLNRIDHVFHSDGIQIEQVLVPKDEFTRDASDHLPLIVDCRVEVAEKQPYAETRGTSSSNSWPSETSSP